MSKLFNLKEWLTLDDAARHLSIVFGEDVTKADVLRFALDGHLRLSVNFVNHARARCGSVTRYTEAELVTAMQSGKLPDDLKWTKFPRDLFAQLQEELGRGDVPFLLSLRIDDERYLTLDDNVTTLKGLWDLPMIGGERLDIEHEYQMLTDGPPVTLQKLDGAFVEGSDGKMCQLQEDFDDNEYQPGSSAQLEQINRQIAEGNIQSDEIETLLEQHKEARKEFLEKRKMRPTKENYYPAAGLPKDGVIVVRTEALREFEKNFNCDPDSAEKPLTTTERKTLLTIVAALCDHSAIDHQGRGAANQIAKLTEQIGAPVSDDTVRRWLKAIPDSVESRMK